MKPRVSYEIPNVTDKISENCVWRFIKGSPPNFASNSKRI